MCYSPCSATENHLQDLLRYRISSQCMDPCLCLTSLQKSSTLDPNNYRQISLTSVVCKLMEKMIKHEVLKHCINKRLLSDALHGFVPNKSCTTNLLESLYMMTKTLDNKIEMDLIFLDFAKAFDKVNHQLLKLKLENYGIKGNLLSWISSFLENRKQRVVLGETVSDWVSVTSGVPQGSVLGPLLFAIYINDLPECIKSNVKMFADDTKIIGTIRTSHIDSDTAVIQNDVDSISTWCKEWRMHLNTDKCKVMHIGKKVPPRSYHILDSADQQKTLGSTTVEKDLGIMISNDLKPRAQVQKASSKANSMLALLKNTFFSREPLLWKKLYTTYVRPHLEYVVSAWSPYTKTDIKTLEKIQRRATRVVPCLKDLSYPERLHNLGLTTLERRHERDDLIEWFKIKAEIDKVTWYAGPIIKSARGGHRERLCKEAKTKTVQRTKFLTNRVVNPWNKLKNATVDAPTTNSFKNRVDADHNGYYSLVELAFH